MKINPGGAPQVVSPAAKTEPNKPAAEVPLSSEGLQQLQKFVATIHGAVDAQIAGLQKKGQAVPPALGERKKAADDLLAAAKSGRSMSAAEVAKELDALLWELNPAQLTQLRDGLQSNARDFGELAQMQKRAIPGLPATLTHVVNLLTDAARVPTTITELNTMLADIETSRAKNPQLIPQLDAQKAALLELAKHLDVGEAVLRPMSLPPTQAGAHEAVKRLNEQLGEVHGQLAALLGDQEPSALTGEAKTKFTALSADAVRVGKDLQTLEAYTRQLDGYHEPSALDRTGILAGVSIGPTLDLAKWIPGFPVPIFGGVGAGLHLFEKDRATGGRQLDWYAAANLQTPFGGAGYAISPSRKGFSAAFNPPLGSRLGISLAQHPFHGRKLDVFIPGLFRTEATSTGALALTLFAPVPIPGVRVGVTVLVRNPVLANITGPVLYALDKATGAVVATAHRVKDGAKDQWKMLIGDLGLLPVPSAIPAPA